jgi:hypothetical protein
LIRTKTPTYSKGLETKAIVESNFAFVALVMTRNGDSGENIGAILPAREGNGRNFNILLLLEQEKK